MPESSQNDAVGFSAAPVVPYPSTPAPEEPTAPSRRDQAESEAEQDSGLARLREEAAQLNTPNSAELAKALDPNEKLASDGPILAHNDGYESVAHFEAEQARQKAQAAADAQAEGIPAQPAADAAAEAAKEKTGEAAATQEQKDKPLQEPTSVETAFSSMRESTSSSRRLVLLGDPEVRARFMHELEARGLLKNYNGQPTVFASNKTVANLWNEAAAAVNDLRKKPKPEADKNKANEDKQKNEPVVTSEKLGELTFKGERSGFLGMGFQRTHNVTFLGAGDAATLKKSKEEVGAFLGALEDKKLISRNSDGTSYTTKGTLRDAVSLANEVAGPHQRQKQAEKDAKHAGDKSGKDASEKTGKDAKATPSLSDTLDKQLGDSTKILQRVKSSQSDGEKLVERVSASLREDLKEVPKEQRASTFAQFAAFTEKVRAMGKGEGVEASQQRAASFILKALDKDKRTGSSASQRFELLLGKEANASEEFGKAYREKLTQLKDAGHLTEAQLQGAVAALERGKLAAAAATKSEAPSSKEDASAAPKAAAEAGAAASKQAAQAPATPVEPLNAMGGKFGASADASADAAKASEKKEPAAAKDAQAATSSSATSSASTTATSTTSASAASSSTPLPTDAFRDRVAALSQGGSAGVTPEGLSRLMADLEGRRGQSLNRLDAREGASPTETVTRLGHLVDEAASGKYSAALTAQAKSLQGQVAKWKEQDKARYPATNQGKVKRIENASRINAMEFGWRGLQNAAVQASSASSAADASAAKQSANPVASSAAPSAATSAPQSPAKTAQTPAPEAAQSATYAPVHSAPTRPSPAAQSLTPREQATMEAVASLSKAFANPQHAFLTDNHEWKRSSVEKAAHMAANLDTKSLETLATSGKLAPEQVTRAAVFAGWLAESANNNRLPGFNTEAGRALKETLNDNSWRLTALAKESGGALTPTTLHHLNNANGMLNSKETHQLVQAAAAGKVKSSEVDLSRLLKEPQSEHASSAQASKAATQDPSQSSPRAARATSHLVSTLAGADGAPLNENNLRNIAKNASLATPANLQPYSPETKALVAVSLDTLAKDLAKDPAAASSLGAANVNKIKDAATQLMDAYSKSPEMAGELNKVRQALNLDSSTNAASGSSGTQAAKGTDAARARPDRER